MKIWYQYGSEHSTNMVMIGRFEKVADVKRVTDAIEEIKEYILKTEDTHEGADSYSDQMLQLIIKHNLHTLHPSELNQFIYDIKIDTKDKEIVVTTDEADISAFLKILVENKAKVEVYSAHFHPNTGKGR